MKYKMKKLLKSLLLDVIQMALLLALMVYSQVIVIRVMITCFPDDTRKGTFGSFIAAFLVTVLCAVMLWMVLLILDRYKVMLFGDSFPTFWNSGKPTTKKLADCVARIPQPPVPKLFKEDTNDGKTEWHLFANSYCVTHLPVVAFVFMPKHHKSICLFYPNSVAMNKARDDSAGYYVFIAWTGTEELEKSAISVGSVDRMVSQCESHLPMDRDEDYFKNIWDNGL